MCRALRKADRKASAAPLTEADEDALFAGTSDIYDNAPTLAWAIPYITFYGGLGVVTAYPKAGKTQMLFLAIAAKEKGLGFLGQPVLFDTCIYMSEQGTATLKDQLARAGLGREVESVKWLRKMSVLHLEWPHRVAVVERLIKRRYSGQRVLVIVDTLAEWIATGPGEENDAGAMRQGMEPLQHLAQETGSAVVAVLHAKHQPGGGDGGGGDDVLLSPVQMVRGSTQIAGSADLIFGIAKPRHRQAKGRRVRHVASEGRIGDGLIEGAAIEWMDDGTYVMLDEGEDLELNRVKQAVVASLEKVPLQTREVLAASVGTSETTLRRALAELEAGEEPSVEKVGPGVRNDPHRWRLPAKEKVAGRRETPASDPVQTEVFGEAPYTPGLWQERKTATSLHGQAWMTPVPN